MIAGGRAGIVFLILFKMDLLNGKLILTKGRTISSPLPPNAIDLARAVVRLNRPLTAGRLANLLNHRPFCPPLSEAGADRPTVSPVT